MTNFKTIVILSGKGGVGKTTLTASIAVSLAKNHTITVADCDVDAPNLALVLGPAEQEFEVWNYIKTSKKAALIKENCKGRQKCVRACNFGAIKWNNNKSLPEFNNLLCVGCGACIIVCPDGAIEINEIENAKIGLGTTNYGFPIISGKLNIGESGSGKVVDAVKNKAIEISELNKAHILLIDAAAGLGCPVIASIKSTDYVILVTEPTPAAFSDFKKALKAVNHFKIPHGMIINRWDINKELAIKIEKFANSHKIPLIGKINYDKRFVDSIVNLKPAVIYEKEFEELFHGITTKIASITDNNFIEL